MSHLERAKRYTHHVLKTRMMWSMDVKSNLGIFVFSLFLFWLLFTRYPEFSGKLFSGFLVGTAIGLSIGLYWKRIMSRNWGFYKKFYGEAASNSARFRMAPKKLELEWPTYLISIAIGVVLFRMVFEGMSWLAGSIFFGFAAGSALGLALILRDLR